VDGKRVDANIAQPSRHRRTNVLIEQELERHAS
jgi:hypothetical protein